MRVRVVQPPCGRALFVWPSPFFLFLLSLFLQHLATCDAGVYVTRYYPRIKNSSEKKKSKGGIEVRRSEKTLGVSPVYLCSVLCGMRNGEGERNSASDRRAKEMCEFSS